MGWLTPRYYVYLIISFRGLYVGKRSGHRVRESTRERRGLFYIMVARCYFERSAYRAESRLINRLRWIGVPLQNGHAPNAALRRCLFSRRRRKIQRASFRNLGLTGLICTGFLLWLIVR